MTFRYFQQSKPFYGSNANVFSASETSSEASRILSPIERARRAMAQAAKPSRAIELEWSGWLEARKCRQGCSDYARCPNTFRLIRPPFAGWCKKASCGLSRSGGTCASTHLSSSNGWRQAAALPGNQEHLSNQARSPGQTNLSLLWNSAPALSSFQDGRCIEI